MSAPLQPRSQHLVPPGIAARRPLGREEFVAFDTETTGLWWAERLVEIAAVRFRGDEVLGRWSALVNPGRPMPEHVVPIHGIDDAMVRDAPDAATALEGFRAFAAGATLLAHHARFDRDIVAAEFARAGSAPPDAPIYCTLALARREIPESPRHGLVKLSAFLGVGAAEGPHRAAQDAEQTRRVFLACAQRMGAEATLDALPPPRRFDGGPRALRRWPKRLRGARRAMLRGGEVVVALRGGGSLRGVIVAALERHGELALDLLTAEGRRGLRASRVASVRRVR
ncbi:MAG: 3'-5' exonuclease [Polyangiales bacterium]